MNKYRKWLGMTAAFSILLSMAVSLTGSAFYYSGYVNAALGLTGEKIAVAGDSNYYPSAYGELNAENSERLIADEKEHCMLCTPESPWSSALVRISTAQLTWEETVSISPKMAS